MDQLITLIVQDCKSCSRLRKTRLQEQAADQKERERRKADWELRYTSRLECDEYESSDDHVAETKCGKCSLSAGRRTKVGRTYGDKRDQDDLYNCEGADCFKAFHRDCRPGLEKDTPESRRAHGLPADQPLQFGRRFEPWLCPACWSTAGRKQIAHERFQLERERHKLKERMERMKRARLPQSEDEQSDPSGDKPEPSTLAPEDHSSIPEPTGLYPRYPVNSSLYSLSALDLSMSDSDAASLALPAAVPAPSFLALLQQAMGTSGVQQHESHPKVSAQNSTKEKERNMGRHTKGSAATRDCSEFTSNKTNKEQHVQHEPTIKPTRLLPVDAHDGVGVNLKSVNAMHQRKRAETNKRESEAELASEAEMRAVESSDGDLTWDPLGQTTAERVQLRYPISLNSNLHIHTHVRTAEVAE